MNCKNCKHFLAHKDMYKETLLDSEVDTGQCIIRAPHPRYGFAKVFTFYACGEFELIEDF